MTSLEYSGLWQEQARIMREQLLTGLCRDSMNGVPSIGQTHAEVGVSLGETVWSEHSDLVRLLYHCFH